MNGPHVKTPAQTTPLYQQISADLRDAIESGTYAPKDRIPSEPELSQKYGVSRITVRRAIEELCGEGYLIKHQGRGTFVSTPRISRRLLQSEFVRSFTEVCRDNGMEPGARLLNRQIVPIRSEEEKFLKLPSTALLLRIQRLRTADGVPTFEENIFLPYEEFRDLLEADLEDVSIFAMIGKVSGRPPAHASRRLVEAVKATPEQSSLLSIPAGDPLLYLHAHFVDAADEPVCIGRQYYVGSRYRFLL